jgi:hypothetical protein
MAGAVMMRRVMRIASSVTSRSSAALRKLKRIAGGVSGVRSGLRGGRDQPGGVEARG